MLAVWLSAWSVHGQELVEPGWFLSTIDTNLMVAGTDSARAIPEDPGEIGFLSGPAIAEATTPEITALARGLENDPKRIFDYVHDHIRYVHYFGSKKGAQLTLLERSGNDFDQSALLVALLRAAGKSAGYQFGMVSLPYSRADHKDFRHCIGLTKTDTEWTNTINFVNSFNTARGYPLTTYFANETNYPIFNHVWVKLTLNQTEYYLDPAFKVSEPIGGLTNLAVAMNLNTTNLLSISGGTNTANAIQSLSESSLRDELRNYTTNLSAYLQTNYPNATVEEILSGQRIVSSSSQALDQLTLFSAENTQSNPWPIQVWDYIPTNFMTTLSLTVDGTNRTLLMPELQGNKLSLTFSTNGLAELRLDEDLILSKQTSLVSHK